MKAYIIVKTGYQSGVYGWNGDWFTIVVIKGKKSSWFRVYESYGGTQDYEAYLNKNGYRQLYASSIYGKVTRKDVGGIRPDALEDIVNFVEGKA